MATHINDLLSAAMMKPILVPQTIDSETPQGDAADLGVGDGPCFAVQMVGSISEDSELTGRVEESHDQSTWAAIDGATFDAVEEAGTQVIRFVRSRRYVRWAGVYDPGEGGEAQCAAVVVQGHKTF